ncbi:MAG TPA: hypothetical protein VHN82_05845, partial [Methanoregula sp.]|nr:hypothetical protein [Methanoregula sp.]
KQVFCIVACDRDNGSMDSRCYGLAGYGQEESGPAVEQPQIRQGYQHYGVPEGNRWTIRYQYWPQGYVERGHEQHSA